MAGSDASGVACTAGVAIASLDLLAVPTTDPSWLLVEEGVNLSKIESRPLRGKPGIECSHGTCVVSRNTIRQATTLKLPGVQPKFLPIQRRTGR